MYLTVLAHITSPHQPSSIFSVCNFKKMGGFFVKNQSSADERDI